MSITKTLVAIGCGALWTLLSPPTAWTRQPPETFSAPAVPPSLPAAEQPLVLPPPTSGPAQPPPSPRPEVNGNGLGDPNQNALAATLSRGGGLSSFLSPTVGHAPFRTNLGITWFPNEPVKNQPTNLGYERSDFSFSCPIMQDPTNEWTALASVRWENFRTGAILPDTGQHFPDDLWNIHLGTNYRHLFDNGWIGGVSLSLGSASDKPFSTVHELVAGTTAFLRVPQGERNAWLFTLNYSTTSEVLNTFPVPGIAYFYNPVDWFQATIGFPMASVVYRPMDDLTLQLSYALLTTVHARAIYRVAPALRVYAAFDMDNESYFPADRLDSRDRLFYYDDRFTGGAQLVLGRHANLDLSGGYVFDRYYFEGRSFRDRNFNRIDVGAGPFAGLQFNVHW